MRGKAATRQILPAITIMILCSCLSLREERVREVTQPSPKPYSARAAYRHPKGSGTPAAAKALWRSTHVGQVPQGTSPPR